MNETRRRYVYAVLVAAGALALFYGWITADALPLWLALAAAILGNGLAFANTTRGKHARHAKEPDEPAA